MNNVVYKNFIVAATGQPPPTFSISLGHTSQANRHGSIDGDGDSDSENGAGSNTSNGTANGNNASNSNNGRHLPGTWQTINEIGDGACLLRCVARRQPTNPEMHTTVRHQPIQHVSHNIHQPNRTQEDNSNLCIFISVGVGQQTECIHNTYRRSI